MFGLKHAWFMGELTGGRRPNWTENGGKSGQLIY